MSEQRDYRDTVFLPKTEFPMKAGLPQKEPGILARWQAEGLYEQVREARKGREKYILHDGPPYANGEIHIGHALNHVLKDMVVRTQTLLGKDAPYVPGWDCHGLPIEWKVEEQYRKQKKNKDEVPAKEFRAECRAYAAHWVDTQREQLKRLGIGGDWDNPYLTMDFDAEATIVAELLKFAESGQLYRGAKPVMWSPVEKTALAEAEVEYEDIVSTQIDVAFEIVEAPNCPAIAETKKWSSVSAVIWTTTPWTIPVNQALSYGAEIEYVLIHVRWTLENFEGPIGGCYIVAAELVEQFVARVKAGHREHAFDEAPVKTIECEEIARFPGSQLEGAVASHPMNVVGGFFAEPRPLLAGEFVTTDSGTGLVHMAPDHGEDDFELCKAHGIGPKFAVEGDGKYREDWPWLGGQGSVINPKFNAPDGPICFDLNGHGNLLAASADYKHSYPHSWRSKAKVIFRCTPQWFVPMDRPLAHLPRLSGAEQRWEDEGGDATIDEAPTAGSPSLRELAIEAIGKTCFYPDKGRNRIGSMVEGRPDWVLSRQRAWGVPITLFVHRESGEYLVDPAVNRRIVDAIREAGVDAWDDETAQALLGDQYDLADYERITDILDVWFDSGSTHAFVLESGRWPDLQWPADLYLEGSDQHRGWFQSSLLEACATRGRAPYDAVLTHGFTMASDGKKMSKSLGNTVDPNKVMETYGADIIRLWALSVDYTEDHRIGDEILKGVADQYRKLRNTFRYLLGALHDYDPAEAVEVEAMPELERYMLALLGKLDGELRQAIAEYDFTAYVRALADFANEDLSAFYFDIRKDSLYCDAPGDPKRRAYRTVLDTLFHALIRYAAPVLVFTTEEVWQSRYPEADSVHLLEWPELHALLRHSRERGNPANSDGASDGSQMDPRLRGGDEFMDRWADLRRLRSDINEAIEPLRREKTVRSSLEAKVEVFSAWDGQVSAAELAELAIVSDAAWTKSGPPDGAVHLHHANGDTVEQSGFTVSRTSHEKCGRCWRHLPEVTEDGALCSRCEQVVEGMDAPT